MPTYATHEENSIDLRLQQQNLFFSDLLKFTL